MTTQRITDEALAKATLEAKMANRAYFQTFDPFDPAPSIKGNPTPASHHVHRRRDVYKAMRAPNR